MASGFSGMGLGFGGFRYLVAGIVEVVVPAAPLQNWVGA